MENQTPHPDTINALRYGADASFAMLAGIQLDVFTPLSNGPLTAEQIAEFIGVGSTRLPLLLYALVAAGLLTEQHGKFANTPESQHFLVKGAPAYVGNMYGQIASQWSAKLKTAASIRTGHPQAHVDFSQSPREEVEALLRRINVRTVATAQALLEHYDFSSAQTLVDVGGGGGGLALIITKACPHLQATVVELPEVTPITQKIVDEEEGAERVTILAADAASAPLTGSYDIAVLQRVLQVLSPEDARQVVCNTGAAINPGGTIYIVGQILDDSRTSPISAVAANLTWINLYTAGESYTEYEHRIWLSEAGFVDIERANFFVAEGLGVMTARKRG
jgi:hypothetical protein